MEFEKKCKNKMIAYKKEQSKTRSYNKTLVWKLLKAYQDCTEKNGEMHKKILKVEGTMLGRFQ